MQSVPGRVSGFTSAADRQRLEALIKRGIRSGLCSPDIPTLTEMAESIDDALFQRIMYNPYHLLPARRKLVYNIRQRHHDRQLSYPLFPVSCVTETSYIVCSSRTVIDSIISENFDMWFNYFYRCLKTFITVISIDLYYADAFCHSATIKRIYGDDDMSTHLH